MSTYMSGLASNLDWQSMIDQLIQIDYRAVTLIQNQQTEISQQKSAWQSLNTTLSTLKSTVTTLGDRDTFMLFTSSLSSSSTTSASDLASITLGTDAAVGSFQLEIDQLASAEKRSSATYSTTTEALGLEGEFLLGGSKISVTSSDTLTNIRNKINEANSGSSPSGVSASIITTGEDSYRLILTSTSTGSSGISIQDASSTDIVQTLGFADSGIEIKNATSSGAKSDAFTSADTAVYSSLGLSAAISSATIQIGAYTNLSIDLSDSLTQIKDSINTQAGADIASIVSEEESDGTVSYRLKLVGTTYVDDSNVLEALGVVKGTTSDVDEIIQSGALSQTTAAGGGVVSAATLFTEINTGSDANSVTDGDTITISGFDHNGDAVSGSFTITAASSALGDLLTYIQDTVYSGNVTASIDANGKITVTDNATGDSSLALTLVANNEGGGTLDFGDVETTTEGRSMMIAEGQDSIFTVDGIRMTRESNVVSDAVSGATLTLKKAEAGTTITAQVERDASAIKAKFTTLVSNFNSVVSFIQDQQSYDSETEETGGPLFGDGTLTGLSTQLMDMVLGTVSGAPSTLNTLSLAGIRLQDDGTLSIEGSTLSDLIETDFETLMSLFTVTGSASSGDLSYVSIEDGTNSGDFDVAITQAAAQASVTGTANLDDVDGLDGDETLTITDSSTGRIAMISLTSGMDAEDAIAAINSELSRTYTQQVRSSSGFQTTTASGGPANITESTVFADLNTLGVGDGNDLSDGDLIIISGTSRTGGTMSGSFEIEDVSTATVGQLLDQIELTFGSGVTASIDSNGRIVVVDDLTGSSQLSVELTYSGDGSLDMGGTMDTAVTGRYGMEITASDNGSGQIVLSHNLYGSGNGFEVSQSADYLGLSDDTHSGLDVEGTINGEAATGTGQLLKGDEGNVKTEGLTIKYSGTSTGSVGSVSLSLGFAEYFERLLFSYTDSYEGYLDMKQDSLQSQIDSFDDQIDAMELRLENKRQRMINQYVAMEKTISSLNTQSQWLSQQTSRL